MRSKTVIQWGQITVFVKEFCSQGRYVVVPDDNEQGMEDFRGWQGGQTCLWAKGKKSLEREIKGTEENESTEEIKF